MSNKYDAFGTQLQMGNGAGPEVFATIGGVRNIDGPGGDVEVRDATSHDSPNRAREKRPGFTDYGDVSFDLLYDPQDAGHMALIAAAGDGELHNFRIVDVDDDASVTSFTGFVKTFRAARPYNDMLSARVSIEVTGAPDFAVAAP